MSRTYAPTLKKLLQHICAYIARYRDTIVKAVGEENASKVDGVVLACNLLMPVLDTVIPDPV